MQSIERAETLKDLFLNASLKPEPSLLQIALILKLNI